ncbi:MAG: thiamine phosphate synthase [Arachnia sp.]
MRARAGLAAGVDWRLYFVTDTPLAGGPERVPALVEQAVLGGAGVVQVRDKELDDAAYRSLCEACVTANERAFDACGRRAALVVNDRLDVAADLGLHFHQGQSDGDVATARSRLGADLLIGLSISNTTQLESELADPTADVLGLSPVWATPTKTDTDPPLGLDGVRALVRRIDGAAAAVAIGGISLGNARDVIATGVDGICVVSAIVSASDPRAASRALLDTWSIR